MTKRYLRLVALFLLLNGCGYNELQSRDEQITAAWSEVVDQFQRRADLIPNLVNVVKGFAQQEKDALLGVTEARAKVGGIQARAKLLGNQEAMTEFSSAQSGLSGGLQRLLVVAENYPQLKSDANFRDLQAQLEGTENRITVARNRYLREIQGYNTLVQTFPQNLTANIFGYSTKTNFGVENEEVISTSPELQPSQ